MHTQTMRPDNSSFSTGAHEPLHGAKQQRVACFFAGNQELARSEFCVQGLHIHLVSISQVAMHLYLFTTRATEQTLNAQETSNRSSQVQGKPSSTEQPYLKRAMGNLVCRLRTQQHKSKLQLHSQCFRQFKTRELPHLSHERVRMLDLLLHSINLLLDHRLNMLLVLPCIPRVTLK